MADNRLRAAEAAGQAARVAVREAQADLARADVIAQAARLATERDDLELERQQVRRAFGTYLSATGRLAGITRKDKDDPIHPAATAARQARDEWLRLGVSLRDWVDRFNGAVESLRDQAKAARVDVPRVRTVMRPEHDRAALGLADGALARAIGTNETMAITQGVFV